MARNIEACAESIVRHYAKKMGLKVVEVRIYDPEMYEFGGLSNYECEVIVDNGGEYEVELDDKQYRMFCRCEHTLIKKFDMNLFFTGHGVVE